MALRLTDLEGNDYVAEASTSIGEELNADSVLSIAFQSTRTNEQFISDLSELWKISGIKGNADDTQYVINFLSRKGIGNKMVAHVKAIPKMFDDLANKREYERFSQSFTAFNFFTLVFKDTPYTFALLDSFDALTFEGIGEGESKLEMFKRGIDRYGIEFEIYGNEVRMQKRVERDMPYQLRWRLNASNIQEEVDATGFWTYARGYGDYGDGEGGEDWQNAKLIREYTSPLALIPNIGIREAKPIKNGNITDETTMDANLKDLVDNSVKVTVTADFHRLKNYPYAEPKNGDLIHLIDERINFKKKVRVIAVSTQRDARGNITKQDVTFGDVGVAKRHQAKINAALNALNALIGGKIKLPNSVFDDAWREATKALISSQSELFYTKNGILAVDKNNPNLVTLFSSAGIGVSEDGGQTFRNSITGKGVVAESIIGQSIIGVNLSSVDETGYFHVNGSDAEFFDVVTGRKVAISPNGLYGRNSNDTIRFQADEFLVTSRALGTSTANVYLAAQSDKEARVVDINDVPSDGEISSYNYLPLRASGFFGNFLNANSGVGGVHVYLRPLSGGEARVTGSLSTDNYYPLRAHGFFGNYLDSNTQTEGQHVYLRPSTGNEVRVTRLGTIDVYEDFRCKVLYRESEVTTSDRDRKKNITDYSRNALDEINSTPIREFHMLEDVDDEKKRLGIIMQEAPADVADIKGYGVDTYAMTAMSWKAIQELITWILEILTKIELQENEIQSLKIKANEQATEIQGLRSEVDELKEMVKQLIEAK